MNGTLRNHRSSFIIHRSSFPMRRSRFLPLFFTVLSIACVIALVVRLRSDMREVPKVTSGAPAPSPSPARGREGGGAPQETMTVAPVIEKTKAAHAAKKSWQSTDTSGFTGGPIPKGLAGATATTATPPPQPRPSALSRVLAPITKILGGSDPATKPPGKPPSAQQISQS